MTPGDDVYVASICFTPHWFSELACDIQKEMNESKFNGPKARLGRLFFFPIIMLFIYWIYYSNIVLYTVWQVTCEYPDNIGKIFHNIVSEISI